MFIATMFSYGHDTDAVGVDGIRGCLGIYLETPNRLFAIHIPDMPQHFATGRAAFVQHVNQTENTLQRQGWRLYAVANGTNRPAMYKELLDYARDLGVRRLMTVRVNEHLGPKGMGQDSAAIVLERPPGQATRLKYMRHDDVQWTQNGKARSGYYTMSVSTDRKAASLAPSRGWHLVSHDNSTIATTNW